MDVNVPNVEQWNFHRFMHVTHADVWIWNGSEMSGKAVMKSIVMPAALSSKPEYSQMGQIAYGEVQIEEGASFNAVVKGINKKKRKELLDKLPVPVHAEIFQRDGYKTVVFALDEE